MIGWEFTRLYIYCTTQCNFACQHCFIGEERKRLKPIHVDLELVKQFLNDFVTKKTKSVNLTGDGNPILHPHFKEIIRLCKMKVPIVSVNTRGPIPTELLNWMAEYEVVVYYSIDWFGEMNDKFCGFKNLWKHQLNTITEMAKRRMKIAIRTTLMHTNLADCLQLIRLVENLRWRGVNIVFECMPYLPYHTRELMPTKDQVKQLLMVCLSKDFCRLLIPGWTCIFPPFRDRASRWWGQERLCEAGRPYGRIAVKEDGTILPCPFEMYEIEGYELVGGKWILDRERVFSELTEYLNTLEIPRRCRECRFMNECKGGCRIYQQLTGDQENCPIPDLF